MAASTVHVTVDDHKLVEIMRDLQRQGKPVRIVADGVEYGVFHEYGTSRGLPARPTLIPAVESNRDALERGMKQANDVTQATAVVDKVAFDVLGQWRENIRTMPVGDHIGLIDTGAFINSTHVVEPGSGEFDYEVDLKVSKP